MLDFEFCKNFSKLSRLEITILDMVLNRDNNIIDCTFSSLARVLEKDISYVRRVVLGMQDDGLIVLNKNNSKSSFIFTINISLNWKTSIMTNVSRRYS